MKKLLIVVFGLFINFVFALTLDTVNLKVKNETDQEIFVGIYSVSKRGYEIHQNIKSNTDYLMENINTYKSNQKILYQVDIGYGDQLYSIFMKDSDNGNNPQDDYEICRPGYQLVSIALYIKYPYDRLQSSNLTFSCTNNTGNIDTDTYSQYVTLTIHNKKK